MDTTISLTILCTVFGLIIAFLTLQRGKAKDDKSSGQQFGVMQSDLGYIKKSIETLNTKLDSQNEKMTELMGRISAVESSVEFALSRLDRIEGKTDH